MLDVDARMKDVGDLVRGLLTDGRHRCIDVLQGDGIVRLLFRPGYCQLNLVGHFTKPPLQRKVDADSVLLFYVSPCSVPVSPIMQEYLEGIRRPAILPEYFQLHNRLGAFLDSCETESRAYLDDDRELATLYKEIEELGGPLHAMAAEASASLQTLPRALKHLLTTGRTPKDVNTSMLKLRHQRTLGHEAGRVLTEECVTWTRLREKESDNQDERAILNKCVALQEQFLMKYERLVKIATNDLRYSADIYAGKYGTLPEFRGVGSWT